MTIGAGSSDYPQKDIPILRVSTAMLIQTDTGGWTHNDDGPFAEQLHHLNHVKRLDMGHRYSSDLVGSGRVCECMAKRTCATSPTEEE